VQKKRVCSNLEMKKQLVMIAVIDMPSDISGYFADIRVIEM